jgi:phosphoribosylformimino-5-aminoimidazole carboxamide ribotide isomerase
VEVIPSIDIKDGLCVRLVQGDYARMTVHDRDPVAVARRWEALGVTTIHVVDLDGAATGAQANRPAVEAIVRAVRVPIQFGGGVRSLAAAEALFDLGVARVVFGTVAVKQPGVVVDAAARWPGRVVLGVDARDGRAATDGWRESSSVDAIDLARDLVAAGVDRVIYTDIARDGTLTEPNYAAMAEMARAVPSTVIASGGVATLAHVERLAETGVAGVIVGKALYAGTLDLAEALAWSRAARC